MPIEYRPRHAQWLKADLRSVDRCVTPWLVAAMHRPMYVVYPHKSNRIVGGALPLWVTRLLSSSVHTCQPGTS